MNSFCRIWMFVALVGIVPMVANAGEQEESELIDREVRQLDDESLMAGAHRVIDRIAGFFAVFVGSIEDATSLVLGLRSGEVSFDDPEQVADRRQSGSQSPSPLGEGEPDSETMGYGNVFIALALAEQLFDTMETPSVEGSIQEILRLRHEEQMNWDQIARELDLNIGEVITSMRDSKPEFEAVSPAQLHQPERPDRLEHSDRPTSPERPKRV